MTQLREHLYKAKCSNTGKWITGSLLIDSYVHPEIDPNNPSCFISDPEWNLGVHKKPIFHEVIPKTVSQFTGSIDNNGNKIFEGDLVKADITELNIKALRYEVRYHNGAFNLFIHLIPSVPPIYIDGFVNIEIIGNIHD